MGRIGLKIDYSVYREIIPEKESCLVVIDYGLTVEQGSDCEKGNKRKGKIN